jgi:regulator of sirC expression with transglutaminase-like and TPR domain
MNLPTSHTTVRPLDYFRLLVQDEMHLPLLEAAASLGHDAEGELDIQEVLARVDRLAERLRRRIAADAPPVQRLRMLTQFFFEELGFEVDANDYYAPDNSYVHRVLDRRRGIPVSLAVVFLEIAQAIGLHAGGISFPGHFLVKVRLPQGEVILDPATGQSLSRSMLEERLLPYREAQGLTGELEVPLGLFLQTAAPRDILLRMLRNLTEIHRSERRWERLVPVLDRVLVLQPQAWLEFRERGMALAELGRWSEALEDIRTYLRECPLADDAPTMRERIAAMQRLLRLH